MKKMASLFAIFLLFLHIDGSVIYAQEQVGIAWEFNDDGQADGWQVAANFEDLTVENGVLTARAVGAFPSLKSSEFELAAAEFGYVVLRMKTPGATSAMLKWDLDTGDWGFHQFDIFADSLFHEYRLALFLNKKWQDQLIKIPSLMIHAPLDARVEIDYIRIVHSGPLPAISSFKTFRTIIKPGETIPLFATVINSGDAKAALRSELNLPEDISLVEGQLENAHGELFAALVDTLEWQIQCEEIGEFDLSLTVFSDEDTVESILTLPVTDQFWQQEEFLLSAWSPPYAWYPPPYEDAVVDSYKSANFDVGLWVRPDDDLIQLYEKYDLKYFILVTHLLGGDEYLRDPSTNSAPEITAEMLARLDPIIEKFRNNPNMLGYHICDEPYAVTFPNIDKVVRYLREKDPTRLSFVNIWPGNGDAEHRDYIEQLLDQTKLEHLSYDRYTFHNGYDGGLFFTNIRVMRKYALRYNLPFFNIVQAIGTNGTVEEHLNWRTPSEAEHRWLAYASLAYGVKGLIWFHWHGNWGVTGNPDRDKIVTSITKLNPEIKNLGQEMLPLRTISVLHSKPGLGDETTYPENGIVSEISASADLIAGFFKDENEEDFVLLMNKNYQDSVTATISSAWRFDQIRAFNASSGEWQNSAFHMDRLGTTFEITLEPGGGKLYDLSNNHPSIVQENYSWPYQSRLHQNYPNPFNPQTTISYDLIETGRVKLTIYDVKGRIVSVLVDEKQIAGSYQINWAANELSSGLFFYRLKTANQDLSRKMLLIR